MVTKEKSVADKDSADQKNGAIPKKLAPKKEEKSLHLKMARLSLKNKLQPSDSQPVQPV